MKNLLAHAVLFLLLPALSRAAFLPVAHVDDPSPATEYGVHVHTDGIHAIVAAPETTNTVNSEGAVEFWYRDPSTGTWAPQGLVYSPNPTNNGRFGDSVSVYTYNDDLAYAVVGAGSENSAKGRAYVYKFSGSSWVLSRTIVASNPSSSSDRFGYDVDLQGNVLICGAYGRSSFRGAAYIFERDGSDNWTEVFIAEGVTYLQPGFGIEVALAEDGVGDVSFAFVGSYLYDREGTSTLDNVGRVNAYKRSAGGTWSALQTIESPTTEPGAHFGLAVAAHGAYLIVGAPETDVDTTNNGEAYIYERNGSDQYVLKSTLNLDGSDTTAFSRHVSISDDGVAAIGEHGYDTPTVSHGRVIIYNRQGDGSWLQGASVQTTDELPGTANLGRHIHIRRGVLVAGSYTYNTTGAVVIFEDDGLTSFPDPTGPETDPSNPLRCGDYDTTNQRYFYDDGTGCETTPTIADACYYSAGDLVTTNPATLRADLSELKADGGTDYIYLAFDIADKYYNTRLVFADAAANQCEHVDWEQVSATRDVSTLSSCFTTFVYRLPWSSAYASDSSKCGWERDDSGTNVKLVLDFAVSADEDLSTMRNGTTITRDSSFSMPVEVQFPVQVTASPVGIQVFAPVRVLAAVTSQTVTINEASSTATLTLDLRTEVQKPFELHAIVESTDSLPTGITLLSDMAGGNDDGTIRQDIECDDTNADCANTWSWQYTTPSVAGGSNPCDFDGTYQVSFSIRCSEVSNTNCPIDSSTDSVEITLSVSTSDHCPTVIDSVDLSAALAVYDLPARADAQDDFVGDGTQDDGQTADLNDWQVAYFAAPVTSTQVAISRTEFNQVWIVRHQETVTAADDDVIVLLDADNTINVAPYNTVGEIDCTVVAGVSNADATPTDVSAATGCSPTNPAGGTFSFNFKHGEGGNSAAGSPSTPIFEFDIRTDSAGFAMDDDAIETMQINAVIDVEYANAAKRVAGSTSSNSQRSTVTSSFSMQTTTTTSSSSTTLLGVNATVVYGAGALLTLAVLAAVVVVSRRRRSSLPSTKLQSSTELTATV